MPSNDRPKGLIEQAGVPSSGIEYKRYNPIENKPRVCPYSRADDQTPPISADVWEAVRSVFEWANQENPPRPATGAALGLDPAASEDQTFHAIYDPTTRTITRYANREEAEAAYFASRLGNLDYLRYAAESAAKSAGALAEALDSTEIRRQLSERGRG